jgi:hypothetical protein
MEPRLSANFEDGVEIPASPQELEAHAQALESYNARAQESQEPRKKIRGRRRSNGNNHGNSGNNPQFIDQNLSGNTYQQHRLARENFSQPCTNTDPRGLSNTGPSGLTNSGPSGLSNSGPRGLSNPGPSGPPNSGPSGLSNPGPSGPSNFGPEVFLTALGAIQTPLEALISVITMHAII